MAGDAIAFLCVCVIRGIKIPFVVDFTSNKEDVLGVVVPIPAAPVEGNVFVCACAFEKSKQHNTIIILRGDL